MKKSHFYISKIAVSLIILSSWKPVYAYVSDHVCKCLLFSKQALRILLSSIESHANRYKRYIVPLLCISVDFYVRIFIQVFTSPSEVKRSPSKQSLVYHCVGCGSYHFQQGKYQ